MRPIRGNARFFRGRRGGTLVLFLPARGPEAYFDHAGAAADLDRSPIAPAADMFDAGNRAQREKLEHCIPREGRPERKLDEDRTVRR